MTGPLLVVGDTFLDADVDGSSRRLSPDAAVPVVDAGSVGLRPGGAGLAALLAARAGVEVVLVTAIGHDESALTLRRLLESAVEVVALPLAGPTMVKTRIRSGGAPQLRLDSGDGRAADELPGALLSALNRAVSAPGAILVADYGRGVAALPELRERLAAAAGKGIPVVWDPHPKGPPPVPGCRVVTPNAAEAAAVTGVPDPADQGRRLCRSWRADAVAVTVGPQGAVLTEARSGASLPLPAPSASVDAEAPAPDTCGAGDQLAVTTALSLRRGSDTRTAVRAGVRAASAFVRSGGVATVSTATPVAGPPLSPVAPDGGDAFALAARVRAGGGRVVAAGGCFDLLHRGHVELLEHARSLGDALVVCLNSDASVRRAKGSPRPLVPAEDRARVLLGLACVDAVAVFGEDTPVAVLQRLRPEIWVKGGDYTGHDLPETAVVERHGGRVVLVPTRPGHSTSRLISRAARPVFPAPSTLEEVS